MTKHVGGKMKKARYKTRPPAQQDERPHPKTPQPNPGLQITERQMFPPEICPGVHRGIFYSCHVMSNYKPQPMAAGSASWVLLT